MAKHKGLREKLTISGLSSLLKAEKRSELAQKLAETADVPVETDLKVGRAGKNGRKEQWTQPLSPSPVGELRTNSEGVVLAKGDDWHAPKK